MDWHGTGIIKKNKWFHTSKCPRLFSTYLYSDLYSDELINNKTWNNNTPPLSCFGQISLSKMDEICPSATPNQASAISMHTPKFIEFYLSYHPEMKIRTYCLQINLSKNNEICLLKFPNQIFTISMFIQNLVKIHWYLLKLSFGNKNTDISSKHNVY